MFINSVKLFLNKYKIKKINIYFLYDKCQPKIKKNNICVVANYNHLSQHPPKTILDWPLTLDI